MQANHGEKSIEIRGIPGMCVHFYGYTNSKLQYPSTVNTLKGRVT